MNWKDLYSNKRVNDKSERKAESGRNDYIRDYDRVIFSGPFRKLQNKTQVFPLPGAFFVHNRLTHSLEVASVGRSLGKQVGDRLARIHHDSFSKEDRDFYRFELSDVIQTACLAHDIGNPPFGHFGEEAIRTFFIDFFSHNKGLGLTENQRRDFEFFEGNANAFRILTTLFADSGLKLTYTTLASVVKYPCNSINGFDKQFLATKKSGFMDGEQAVFENIATELVIPGGAGRFKRHPFVYLVEAADDLCYRIIDLEDAFKLNVVTLDEVTELLIPVFNDPGQEEYLHQKLKTIEDDEQKLAFLRALLINRLTGLCTEVYIQNEALLLDGELNAPLMGLLEDAVKNQLKKIDAFSIDRIYNHQSVIEKELAGHHVLYGLLEDLTGALIHWENTRSQKVLRLIPGFKRSGELYKDLLQILDFVSQMTDDFAMDLYKKVRGIY